MNDKTHFLLTDNWPKDAKSASQRVIRAVYNMGIESLSPDNLCKLEGILCDLSMGRRLNLDFLDDGGK